MRKIKYSDSMLRNIELKTAVLYDRVRSPALARKSLKALNIFCGILQIFKEMGLRSAAHYCSQQWWDRKSCWKLVKFHQEKRLNHLLHKKNALLYKIAQISKVKHIADLRYDTINEFKYQGIFNVGTLSHRLALDLYHYYLHFGDFRTALFFRKIALAASLCEQKGQRKVSPCAIKAALELGWHDVVFLLLDQYDVCMIDENTLMNARNMALIMRGDQSVMQNCWQATHSEDDNNYLDFIRGKTIAVVGPSMPDEELGAEIDGFDLVVRTNFRMDQDLPAVFLGSRTDIAYYNHVSWRQRRDAVLESAGYLKWVNLKGRNEVVQFNESASKNKSKCRVYHQAESVFFTGAPLGVPNILYDLLHFSPKCIKLFCSSLYISGINYNPGYHSYDKTLNHDVSAHARSLRVHDVFSSYIFVRYLLKTGAILADKLSQATLETCEQEYASRINKIYGRDTLDSVQ
ncbi:MAG: hypothetical protein HQM16_07850 [Deltaproteobacteria bacterium]|nr:hypothetical protein [Deltaproteobacteria bacterium]